MWTQRLGNSILSKSEHANPCRRLFGIVGQSVEYSKLASNPEAMAANTAGGPMSATRRGVAGIEAAAKG